MFSDMFIFKTDSAEESHLCHHSAETLMPCTNWNKGGRGRDKDVGPQQRLQMNDVASVGLHYVQLHLQTRNSVILALSCRLSSGH